MAVQGATLDEVEAYSRQAIQVARRQKVRYWELWVTVSLARLWQSKDKREAAHKKLAGIYHGFSEGYETADLKEARMLLAELSC